MIDDLSPYQNDVAIHLGYICGISFCVVFFFLSKFWRKKALKNIGAKLEPDEHIAYEAKLWIVPDMLAPFFMGLGLGEYLIPFWIFPEVQQIGAINREYLLLCVFGELLGIFLALYICSWIPVYTNKRFIQGWGIKFMYKLKGIFHSMEDLFYKDAVSFYYQNDFFYRALYMKNKDNKLMRIGYCLNKKEIEEYVKQQLISNNIREGK